MGMFSQEHTEETVRSSLTSSASLTVRGIKVVPLERGRTDATV